MGWSSESGDKLNPKKRNMAKKWICFAWQKTCLCFFKARFWGVIWWMLISPWKITWPSFATGRFGKNHNLILPPGQEGCLIYIYILYIYIYVYTYIYIFGEFQDLRMFSFFWGGEFIHFNACGCFFWGGVQPLQRLNQTWFGCCSNYYAQYMFLTDWLKSRDAPEWDPHGFVVSSFSVRPTTIWQHPGMRVVTIFKKLFFLFVL